ncbi:MAG TPA: hypothetical protein VGH38_13190, partial [Bryobacteraceae bacterium]
MAIIYLEPKDLTTTAPQHEAGLLTVRVHRQGVGNHFLVGLLMLKVQAGAPAIAAGDDLQLFNGA